MTKNSSTLHLAQYAPLENRETAIQFMESIPVGIYVMKMDIEGKPSFSYASDRFIEMFGWDREAVLKDTFSAFNCVHPEERDEFVALNLKVFKEVIPFYWEGRCVVRGETLWIIAESIPRKLDSGIVIWEGCCTDITKQKKAELKLQETATHVRALLDNSPVPTAINSMDDGRITYLNQSFTETFGYTLEDIPTVSTWAQSAYPDVQYRDEVFQRWNESVNTARKGDLKVPPSELTVVCKDGRSKDIIIAASFMNDMLLVSLMDITERKIAERAEKILQEANEEKIRFLTYFDPLTNLPNRQLCKILLEAALERATARQTQVAILFIDVDDFKFINKNYVYATGDQVLSTIAARIRSCLVPFDSVCRMLGDEFVVLLSNVQSQESVQTIAENILDRIAQPIALDSDTLTLTATVGASLFPEHGKDVITLLQNAEFATAQAKAEGRHHTYRLFQSAMREHSAHRAQTIKELNLAVKQNDFVLHYQPQIELDSGKLIGVEALLRWNDGGEGLRLPNSFIPLAEQSHLIIQIGEWVLREACRQLSLWEAHGVSVPSIGINLSAFQFSRSDIVRLVETILAKTGVDPNKLDLELTESVVMSDDNGEISDKLNKLSNMGLKLSVDDFGTGYSSLTYLKKFPVDRLKIDQSFVSNITKNNVDRSIVQSIINLAESLGIDSIAEGVEDEATLNMLKKMGCAQAQGYLIGRPMCAEALERVIREAAQDATRAATTSADQD